MLGESSAPSPVARIAAVSLLASVAVVIEHERCTRRWPRIAAQVIEHEHVAQGVAVAARVERFERVSATMAQLGAQVIGQSSQTVLV